MLGSSLLTKIVRIVVERILAVPKIANENEKVNEKCEAMVRRRNVRNRLRQRTFLGQFQGNRVGGKTRMP